MKSKARIARLFILLVLIGRAFPWLTTVSQLRGTVIFLSSLKNELLELFGMPVVRAKGESEALCAQLYREGHVDACITSDSDTFLYGAKCVIKCIRPNNKVRNSFLDKI